ncbi:MAG TPA: hypothetical protein VFR66_18200 [Burkholderiales bacterium]|nr:hypothetical protein [Burkholderiales bacterium]
MKRQKRNVVMNTDVAARALAALDEIRGLLQAAQFAAYKFEQMGLQHSLETLSDHIDRVKVAADDTRARIQRAVRRSAVAQLSRLDTNGA